MRAPFRGPYPYPYHHVCKEGILSTIAEVEKNSRERIRISIEEYRGHKFIDCRVHYEDSQGEWKPTKKGIALNADTIDEVIEALQKGSNALEEHLSPLPHDRKADRPSSKPILVEDNRSISDKVRAWVSSVNGSQFSVKDSQRALGLTERKQAHLVNVVFSKMAEEGLIERTGQGRGVYQRRVTA